MGLDGGRWGGEGCPLASGRLGKVVVVCCIPVEKDIFDVFKDALQIKQLGNGSR